MLDALLNGCSEHYTQRNRQTNATYVSKPPQNHLRFRIGKGLCITQIEEE